MLGKSWHAHSIIFGSMVVAVQSLRGWEQRQHATNPADLHFNMAGVSKLLFSQLTSNFTPATVRSQL